LKSVKNMSLTVEAGSAQARALVVERAVTGPPDEEAPVAKRDCKYNRRGSATSEGLLGISSRQRHCTMLNKTRKSLTTKVY